ncbi:MAG TPA: aminotransferase class III-fold pyridoxal phosphate-dependent enzyme [Candidatus Dormibacteraeota bacterium]|nr:aminotransferase class III-fold pyridoxal phosphate-dependent enzyme [Candidatus Dormibacteraeota bacterium]
MTASRYAESEDLLARARRVVPGGVYGHQSPRMVVGGAYPYFFARGEGCRVWDVDGNEFIDLMCSYGPIVLGHRHPVVEEAARRQMADGDCFNAPSRRWVELAEKLVAITPFADWAAFAKNGSDVCTWSVEVAREHTGRPLVAKAEGAYHGSHAWCTPAPAGITPADTANVATFTYNDLDSVRRLVEAHGDALAAIIVSPFRHDAFHDQELPVEGFLPGVRALCDAAGVVMILDDVRAGFRLHLGGSGERFGVRPDLACYAKALANGYPLAACVGREPLKGAAERVYFTGSYFTSAVPMAAALACLAELEATGAIAHMAAMGLRLQRGLEAQAASHRLPITYSGPPAIPFMTFVDDVKFARSRAFAAACAEGGVYLTPYHNWFLSAAHQERDIDQVLEVTDTAFAVVRRAAA